MASLLRTRSLRKPATELPPREKSSDPRNVSPSRLPVKPTASGITNSSRPPPALRPTKQSSAPLGRSLSLRQQRTPSGTLSSEPVKKETSRYPPSTTLTRNVSVSNRPTSSGSSGPSARRPATSSGPGTASHARATSATVSSSSRPTSRPPSRPASRPPSREQATATTLSRTGHRRAVSVDKTAPVAATTTTSASAATVSTPTGPSLGRARAAYVALQQSPSKTAPKTPTHGPPSPSKLPANVAATAETNKLQTELLQLYLLHKDAGSVNEQWHASAKRIFGQRFHEICDTNKALSELETAAVEERNIAALQSWAYGDRLEENIQGLDQALTGVWMLSEPGGRYARITRRFERWIDHVCEIEDARADEDGGQILLETHKSIFIEPLDDAWTEECVALSHRLAGWQRQLDELDDVADARKHSALSQVLAGAKGLVEDMAAELQIMENIAEAALAREEHWIERMNREDDEDDTPRAGAIWRAI